MSGKGNSVVIALHIDAQEYLKRYRLANTVVSLVSEDGRSVRFPASILQRFVTHDGVQGRFRIAFDGQGKFQHIERLS